MNSSGKHNLSDYINALSTLTVKLTPAGVVEFVNKAAAEATGFPANSFIGKAFKDCYWWSFSAAVQDQLDQDIKECVMGKRIDREVKVRLAGEVFMDARFILTPIKNATGQVIYLVAEGQDITERTKDLRNLSDYINALKAFTVKLTSAGDVIVVNKAAAEAAGLPVDSFIGKALKDCYWWNFSRESQELLGQDIQECALGKRIDREVEIQIAGGQFMTAHFFLTPIKNAAGQVTYLVAEGQDVTKRTEDLRDLSDYINALSTFTALLTPAGEVKLINESVAETSGLSVDSMIGKLFKDCYWWCFSREVQDQLVKGIEECARGKRIDYEAKARLDSGVFLDLRLILTPIKNAGGQVTYLVAEGQDITQLKQLELTLRQEKEMAVNLATTDSLTGLPNRRHFMEYADDKIFLAQRRGETLALLYVDLDGFKSINDGISHQAGDIVLTTLGERLTRFVRKGEMIARIGGDEFAMLIYGYKNTEELESVAKRLIELCYQPISIDKRKVNIGVSIGISTYPGHALSMKEFLSSADAAMYKIKRTTKGAYAFAD